MSSYAYIVMMILLMGYSQFIQAEELKPDNKNAAVAAATLDERAELLREKNLLDLKIEVIKKQIELAKQKIEKSKVDQSGFEKKSLSIDPTSNSNNYQGNSVGQIDESEADLIQLLGVRGLNGNLTGEFLIGGNTIYLSAGEHYAQFFLKQLSPLCAILQIGKKIKTICLSSEKTIKTDLVPNQTKARLNPPSLESVLPELLNQLDKSNSSDQKPQRD